METAVELHLRGNNPIAIDAELDLDAMCAVESKDTERLNAAEANYRRVARGLTNYASRILAVKDALLTKANNLEKERLHIEKEKKPIKHCKPNQSGRKVQVAISTEALIASLSTEQAAQLMAALQEKANA